MDGNLFLVPRAIYLGLTIYVDFFIEVISEDETVTCGL
jgi:hypothetical protein